MSDGEFATRQEHGISLPISAPRSEIMSQTASLPEVVVTSFGTSMKDKSGVVRFIPAHATLPQLREPAIPNPHSRRSSISSTSSLESHISEHSSAFAFFALPYELRLQVLENILRVDRTIDIDFNASGITSMFLVSKRFHEEAAEVFFSRNTFRLLPTHSKAAAKRAQPLVKSFPAKYRKHVTRLELRLGPFWTAPPACWRVSGLGCKDLVKVRRLHVFVECDPSIPLYRGYRKSETFYTDFCSKILVGILKRMPALEQIHFDGYSAVSPTGPLVQRMVEATQNAGKAVSWGSGLSFEHRLCEKVELVCIALDRNPRTTDLF